jgi:hypothetical protein
VCGIEDQVYRTVGVSRPLHRVTAGVILSASDERSTARPTAPLRSHPQLLALCMGLPFVEATVLWMTGLSASLALAPQITAPAPLGCFHDLRWLLVYHPSWSAFAFEAAAAVAFRSILTAALVRAAWPRDDHDRPSFVRAVRHSAAFTLAAELLLLPFAALLVGLAVVPVSWLFFAGMPGAVVLALLLHHGVTRSRWWRDAPPLRSTGWLALAVVVLTLDGAALSVSPAAFRLPVALAAGLFNAWAWTRVVRVLGERTAPRIRPVAPLGFALLAGLAAVGIFLGLGHGGEGRLARSTRSATPSGRPVLVVTGFNSSWDGAPSDHHLGAEAERRFSYRGIDALMQPLPYDRADTHRSVPLLVELMARQVDALHEATGRRVDIVAESEGSIVAETYVAVWPDAPVRRVVLLSPLVQPGRAAVPPRGEDGWGVATGWVLRGVTALTRSISATDLGLDAPFVRSLVDEAPALRGLLACRPRQVEELALFPLADAVVSPHPSAVSIRDSVVPAFHGGLLEDGTVQRAVAVALRRGRLPDLGAWGDAERVVSVMSAAWQAPVLPISVGWRDPDRPTCRAATAELRRWVRPPPRG